MRKAISIASAMLAVLVASAAPVAAPEVPCPPKRAPFEPPPSAVLDKPREDGKGWCGQGVMSVTLANAESQMRGALARSGWAFVHRIPLAGSVRGSVSAFRRGREELTLMMWRLDVSKTGFSWGRAAIENREGGTK
jgi:hypothetical protein